MPPDTKSVYLVKVARPSIVPAGGRLLTQAEHAALANKLRDIVDQSHLFRSLSDADRKSAFESAYVVSFSQGDMLMREGESGDLMFIVLTGKVSVTRQGDDGRTLQLAELGPGACLGEGAVITGAKRTASVQAITDEVDVAAFARHRIQRILDAAPRVRALLEGMVTARARDTIDKARRAERQDTTDRIQTLPPEADAPQLDD